MKKKIFCLIIATMLVLSNVFPIIASEQMELQDAAISKHIKLLESFKQTKGSAIYPDYYSGAYLNDNNELVILVKETEMNYSIPIDAYVRPVKYSLNNLEEARDQIDAYVDANSNEAIVSNISGFGILEDKNKVLVSLLDMSDENIRTFLKTFNTINPDMLKFEERGFAHTDSASLGTGIYYNSGPAEYHYSQVLEPSILGMEFHIMDLSQLGMIW